MFFAKLLCGLSFLLALLDPSPVRATWSIVAVDEATGQVGGASATCTPWASAILGPVPGKGIIVTQAASNKAARHRGELLLQQKKSPEEIIAAITDPAFDPTHANQQHGIAALGFDRNAAGYTGGNTVSYNGDLQGDGVSVQGNILAGEEVLTAALAAFQAAARDPALALSDRLLRALEAGAAAGGDRRCGRQTAISAYLIVVGPKDTLEAPMLRISVPMQYYGGANPVDLLREEYDRKTQP